MKTIGISLNALCSGGLEVSVLNLIKALKKLGKYSIVVISICGGEMEDAFNSLGIQIRYGAWDKNYEGIDLVINNASGHGYSIPKKLEIPCIEILHSHFCMDIPKDVAWVISVNDNLRDRVVANDAGLANRISAIPLGIDMEYFKPETTVDDVLVAGGSGRLVSVKRPAHIIEPFSKAFKNNKAKLLFVGDGEEADNIRKTSERFGVDAEITGTVSDVRPYIARMDIYCTVSSYESFSLSTLEAMAMGKIIIATRTDGISKLLDDESAILIPKDTIGLERNIEAAFRKATGSDNTILGIRARERAERLFSLDNMILKYDEIITRILT